MKLRYWLFKNVVQRITWWIIRKTEACDYGRLRTKQNTMTKANKR